MSTQGTDLESRIADLEAEVEHHLSEAEVEAAQVTMWQQRFGKQMGITDEWVRRAAAAERKLHAIESLIATWRRDAGGNVSPEADEVEAVLAGAE